MRSRAELTPEALRVIDRTYARTWVSHCCEHCDGERQLTRKRHPRFYGWLDSRRGYVCRSCDSALDAMEREPAPP